MTLPTNILHVYMFATDDEINAGTNWYNEAHRFALQLCPDDVWMGAGIISAFSPLTPWVRNVVLAHSFVANGGYLPGGTLGNSIRHAEAIYSGTPVLDVLTTDKTRAFACAIAEPDNAPIATIDRHAHDIAMGRVYSESERKIGKRVFASLSDAYVDAADMVGFSVAQLQAITWIAWRRQKGIVWAG